MAYVQISTALQMEKREIQRKRKTVMEREGE